MEETPIDYVAAAIVYLMYNDDDNRANRTDEDILQLVNEGFDSDLPIDAVSCALSVLVSFGLFITIPSRFVPQYYSAVPKFNSEVAKWRYEKVSWAAKVFDNFMNGPAHWMHQAFASDRFRQMLTDQLTPVSADEAPAAEQIAQTSRLMTGSYAELARELDLATSRLDTLELDNASKSQAYALLSASRSLAEAPEPPVDVIWELLQRANNISGIASLMLSVIALFARR